MVESNIVHGEVNGESRQRSTRICGVALDNNSRGIYKQRVVKVDPLAQVGNMKNREVLASGMLAQDLRFDV